MKVIKATADFISYLDPDPKWGIIVEPLEDGLVNIQRYEELYKINARVNFSEIFKEDIQILDLSVKSVRARTQKELDLEIFPSLNVEKIGFARKAVESALADENYPLERIDIEAMATISCSLYRKSRAFLPLIKNLVTLNASDIVKITSPFLVQAKA